jgi:sporulation protein YhbH
MDYKDIWSLRKPGERDSARHKEKIKEAIRDNLRHIISEENIITSHKGKKVKIPMKYLDMWRFKAGKNSSADGRGVGHGDAKPGDVIAKEGEKSSSGNKAGQEAGDDIYEEDVDLDEVVEMMLEDLDLPFLEQKQKQVEVETEETVFQDIAERGLPSNIDKRRTILENMKRNAAKGKMKIGGIIPSDLRYKVWENVIEKHSNAAVFLLMDRSGSMTEGRKYIVKSFFWWMVRFIEKKYSNVKLIFIAHDTEAREVEESSFFQISQSGGTMCSSAFKLAKDIINDRFPTNIWNNYVFEFSDGDNWGEDNERCVEIVKDLLTVCQAVGYGEVEFSDWLYGYESNKKVVDSRLKRAFLGNQEIAQNKRFLTTSIRDKEDIYDCLRQFLQGIDGERDAG